MAGLATCSRCSYSRKAALSGSRAPFLPQRPAVQRRQRSVAAQAALDPSTVYAVTQQGIAYVAVLGGEAAFTGLTTDAATPGRPTVQQTMLGAGGTLAALALVQQDGFVGSVGCAVGALVGAAMLSTMIQRFQKTPFDPNDWPGAKAWPFTMGLISFFSLSVFFQALVAALK